MKVFIDTNIWLRFFLNDVPAQSQDCIKLFQKIEQGDYRPYTSAIVCLEAVYILEKLYGVPKDAIWEYIDGMLETRNLTIIEKTYTRRAIILAKASKRKISDCLIVAQMPKEMILCTYDRELKKLYSGLVKTPGEFFD